MTNIPDDVVERAFAEFKSVDSPILLHNHRGISVEGGIPLDVTISNDAMRAAGRVFVEWEREQCAKACEKIYDESHDKDAVFFETLLDVAAAIRARGE